MELTIEEQEIINRVRDGYLPIWWHTDDFVARTQYMDKEDLYDPMNYEYALAIMLKKHDANVGITWDTIDYYLDEFCRK